MSNIKVEHPQECPACGGEITFGFGLAGGGVDSEQGTVPGAYFMCLDCGWMGRTGHETICFPHGLVEEKSGA